MKGKDRAALMAMDILSVRRERSLFLPAEIFSEPAWDLLLELFLADKDSRRLTGRSVSQSANIAPAVMSLWLKYLNQLGLILGDGTGNLDDELTLSENALDSIEKLLAVAQ